MSRTALSRFALALSLSASAFAQAPFAEVEPNSAKAQATQAFCMTAGDFLTGTTTGSAPSSNLDSADYFLVRTCPLPLGIYEHTLTLASTTPGHAGSIRGLDQAGALGLGGKPVLGTDALVQPLLGAEHKWYGFGKSEELYVRVDGTAATVAAYTHTLATVPIFPTALGAFDPGIITISSVGMGHLTDTELWVYDAHLDPIAGYGNDDTPPPVGAAQSTLTRFYAPGVFYLAVSTFNFANEEPSPFDDAFVIGSVLDFPGAALSSLGGPGVAVDFSITDAAGVTPVVAALGAPGEVLWFRFQVGEPMVQNCFPGGGGIIPCPCGQPANPVGGCANHGAGATTGAVLNASGIASLAADTIVLETSNHRPGALVTNVFFTGSGALSLTGIPNGAGVRCVTTALKRLYTGLAVGGVLSKPGPGDSSVSVRSAQLAVPIAAGQTRHYFNLYRDPAAAGPCGNTASTVNATNTGSITWAP
jgi:hypothetical protein